MADRVNFNEIYSTVTSANLQKNSYLGDSPVDSNWKDFLHPQTASWVAPPLPRGFPVLAWVQPVLVGRWTNENHVNYVPWSLLLLANIISIIHQIQNYRSTTDHPNINIILAKIKAIQKRGEIWPAGAWSIVLDLINYQDAGTPVPCLSTWQNILFCEDRIKSYPHLWFAPSSSPSLIDIICQLSCSYSEIVKSIGCLPTTLASVLSVSFQCALSQ